MNSDRPLAKGEPRERDAGRDPVSGTPGPGGLTSAGTTIDSAAEDAYWRENYASRPYIDGAYGYDDYGGVAASARAAAGPRVSEYYSYSPPAKASSITFTKKLAVKVNTRTQWKRNGKLVAHTTHLGTLHHKHTACTDTWSRSAKLTGTIHFNTGNRKLGSVVSKSWPVTVAEDQRSPRPGVRADRLRHLRSARRTTRSRPPTRRRGRPSPCSPPDRPRPTE